MTWIWAATLSKWHALEVCGVASGALSFAGLSIAAEVQFSAATADESGSRKENTTQWKEVCARPSKLQRGSGRDKSAKGKKWERHQGFTAFEHRSSCSLVLVAFSSSKLDSQFASCASHPFFFCTRGGKQDLFYALCYSHFNLSSFSSLLYTVFKHFSCSSLILLIENWCCCVSVTILSVNVFTHLEL